MRIFLVEDSAPVRKRLEAILAGIAGALVIGHAEEADAAVQAILAAQPDVVVLDLKLAKGSGFDVLRALRAAKAQADVYMLTNFASPAYRSAAERLGVRGFFDKSQEFEHLRDALAARATAR